MKYEELLTEIEENHIKLYTCKMHEKVRGLCIGNSIVINKDIESPRELNCILAEEIGHYKTTVGNITGNSVNDRRQEKRARVYAYDRLVGLEGILKAWQAGCANTNETAEYLNITEEFLRAALEYYAHKYGISVKYKDKIIEFLPNLKVKKNPDVANDNNS